MSMFGKILTVLNVLAAIAFLALAGMDYSKRQSWAYAIFRYELAIHGLPLDDKDDSWKPGTPIAKDLTSNTLKDLFSTSPPQIRTQLEAVESLKNGALKKVDDAPDDKAKRVALAEMWLPLLPHLSQRDEVLAALDGPAKKPVDELKGLFAKEFHNVIQEINKPSSAAIKRMKVADLLYNLNPTGDPATRQRVQTIVGLEQFTLAAERQATNLFAMAVQMQHSIRDEQGAFVRRWENILAQLTVLNEQMKADSVRLDEQKKVLEQNNLILTARKAARDELIDQVRQAGDKATAETSQLAKLQQQLFDLQRDIAAARAGNEALEQQIRTQEVGK